MIYEYYCTNCGQKLPGNSILFDLAQMLDIHSDTDAAAIFIPFSPWDLKNKARQMNIQLTGKVRLEITLRDILMYMSGDLEREVDQQAMRNMRFSQFNPQNLVNLLSVSSLQTEEVSAERIRYFVDAIMAKMKTRDLPGEVEDAQEWEENTENYYTYCWVEPVYFEGTDEIYTIKFSDEENPVNLKFFENIIEIRGYCPGCRKPIVRDAGRYEHKLVGFLGAQSAGKTSLFVAMINELPEMFAQLGIRLPDPLCLSDGKYDRLQQAMLLHSNGWAVPKTDAKGAAVESYNATLLIESVARRKKVLVSFVDIAGELCYDVSKRAINQEAFQKFPLIVSCHLYMLCTCVSQKGYGNADQESANIPNTALLAIANAIYDNLRDPMNIPPMCLVVTKVDMAHTTGVNNSNGQNPFEAEGMPRIPRNLSDRMGNAVFNPLEQMSNLKDLFERTGDEDVLESLKWCCNTYRNIFDKTYFTMISCSALGMQGKKYDKEIHDLEKDGDHFQSVRLEKIWIWILSNLGIIPIKKNGYVFEEIPSYGEAYYSASVNPAAFPGVRCACPLQDEKKRIDAIPELFLNRSRLDAELHLYDEEVGLGPGEGNRIQRLKEQFRMNARERIVRDYLSGKNR